MSVRQSAWLRNARSLARHWQTHLPDTMADNTSLLNQSGTGGSTLEKPAKTLGIALITVASNLVRAPNSRSEFESPMQWEHSSLAKNGKTLGVRGLSTISSFCQCSLLSQTAHSHRPLSPPPHSVTKC
jgi:hypothetical protein